MRLTTRGPSAGIRARRLAMAAVSAVLPAAAAVPAVAQDPSRIQIELPDKRVAPLSELTDLRRRLHFPLAAMAERAASPPAWLAVFTPGGPFCPGYTGHTFSQAGHVEAEAGCDRAVRSRLTGFRAEARERCKCVKVLEGRPADRLRVTNVAILDVNEYTVVTFAVSGRTTGEILRGFRASDRSEFRWYNEDRKLICGGRRFGQNETGKVSCFDGRVTGTGRQRFVRGEQTAHGTIGYDIGRFDLSNGERLDFVTSLSESELRQRHPNFPN